MLELRDYQSVLCDYVDKHLAQYKRPFVYCIPCGSGKSLCLAEIAKRHGKVLVLTLNKELCKQDFDEAVEHGVNACMYSASWNRKEVGNITIATIGSAYKHPELFTHVEIVIIDECQNVDCSRVDSMFMKLLIAINRFRREDGGRVKVVGLTASPWRNVTKVINRGQYYDTTTYIQPLNRIPCKGGFLWSEIVEGLTTKQAMERGYLTPVEYYSSPIDGKLVVNSTGADYTEESLDLWGENAIDRCLSAMKGSEEKWGVDCGIVALPFIRHAEALQALCEREGISSVVVHSKTPQRERERAITAFKNGEIKWLIQCSVALVGFNCPASNLLLWCRPCLSLQIFYQAVGRIMRLSEGKKVARVLDLAGTLETFGKVEDVHLGKEDGFKTIIVGGRGQISGKPLREFRFIRTKRKEKENGR